jgi:hypothetical protein
VDEHGDEGTESPYWSTDQGPSEVATSREFAIPRIRLR